MGIQNWSKPGSEVVAVDRPYTGIFVNAGNSSFSVVAYCDAYSHATAVAKLRARVTNSWQFVACIPGNHSSTILNVLQTRTRVFNSREG